MYDVVAYGAVGDGVTDDRPAIQAALNAAYTAGGGTVFFPPGLTYFIGSQTNPGTGCLFIKRNTRILAYGATILRGQDEQLLTNYDGVTTTHTAYSGHSDIVIEGGTWDAYGGNVDGRFQSQKNTMAFAHAERLRFRDMRIKDTTKAHAIEVNSLRNVRIDNCVFEGFWHSGTRFFSEAVQIDGANGSGGLGAPPYDHTTCQDIEMVGCTMRASFANGPFGNLIGGHSAYVGQNNHRDIRIIGNHVESTLNYGIRVLSWDTVTIVGNTIRGTYISGARAAISVEVHTTDTQYSTRINIADNVIFQSGSAEKAYGAIHVEGTSAEQIGQVRIANNTIRDHKGKAGIYVEYADRAQIIGNSVSGGIKADGVNEFNGIYVQNATDIQYLGNLVTSSDGYGIYHLSGHRAHAMGNRLWRAEGGGIYFGTDTVEHVIVDNYIFQCNQGNTTGYNGIRVSGARCVITGNVAVPKGSGTELDNLVRQSSNVATYATGNVVMGTAPDPITPMSSAGTVVTSGNTTI